MSEEKKENLNPLEQAFLKVREAWTGNTFFTSDYSVKMDAKSCERDDIPRSGLQEAICNIDKKEAQKRGL
jgi:hypothetical protein